MDKIKLGITLGARKHSDYVWSEVDNFINCSDGITPQDLQTRYEAFLTHGRNSGFRRGDLVDFDVARCFMGDLDNRADIDYREGHYDEEPSTLSGGKYFSAKANQLAAHLGLLTPHQMFLQR